MSSWKRNMETGNDTQILSDRLVKGVIKIGRESPFQ
jgi:hypothetical protein